MVCDLAWPVSPVPERAEAEDGRGETLEVWCQSRGTMVEGWAGGRRPEAVLRVSALAEQRSCSGPSWAGYGLSARILIACMR